VLGPNPGTIVLQAPLANSYPTGAPVAVVIFSPPAAAAAPPVGPRATPLMCDMPAGSTTGITSSGSTMGVSDWGGNWTANAVVQATLPDGSVYYNSLAKAPAAQNLDQVTLVQPVQSAHPAGSIVVSRSQLIGLQALDRGLWGNRLVISVQDESPGLVANAAVAASPAGGTQLDLATTTGIQPGSYLEMLYTGTSTLVDPRRSTRRPARSRSTRRPRAARIPSRSARRSSPRSAILATPQSMCARASSASRFSFCNIRASRCRRAIRR
jgi:hypothetical protein